jgi:hypothetical protein
MPPSAEAGRPDGTESAHGRGDQGLRYRATTKQREHWSDRMSRPVLDMPFIRSEPSAVAA